ncbi:MAG: hypothetical protein IIZ39_00200, partial [Blautia sp.]|nr:hypothetical protein [Blautia sp.]
DRVLLSYLLSVYGVYSMHSLLMALALPFTWAKSYENARNISPESFVGQGKILDALRVPQAKNREEEVEGSKEKANETVAPLHLIYGKPGSGLSSVLVRAITNVMAEGQLGIYVNLKDANCEEAITRIEKELKKLDFIPAKRKLEDWEDAAFALYATLEKKKDIRFCLLALDNVDAFLLDSNMDGFEAVKELLELEESLSGRFHFVMAGKQEAACYASVNSPEGQIFIPYLRSLPLMPLTTEEAITLLTWPLSYMGIALPEEEKIKDILTWMTPYPGLIQILSAKIFSLVPREGNLPYQVTDDLFEEALQDSGVIPMLKELLERALLLDVRYFLLALLIRQLDTGSKAKPAYTVIILSKLAKEHHLRHLETLKRKEVTALLDEMVLLQLLKKENENSYAFAYPHYGELLCPPEAVAAKLQELDGKKEVGETT